MTHKNYLGIVAAVSALVLGLASAGFAADQSAVKIKDSGSAIVACLTGDIGNPNATVTISPTIMWPPNHKLRPIDLSISLDTPPGVPPENVSLVVDSIVSDQQATDDVGHHGCGQKTAKQGPDVPTTLPTVTGDLSTTTDALTTSFLLRAERCAKIGARTYTVSLHCCDNTAVFCEAADSETLTVVVPKKKPK